MDHAGAHGHGRRRQSGATRGAWMAGDDAVRNWLPAARWVLGYRSMRALFHPFLEGFFLSLLVGWSPSSRSMPDIREGGGSVDRRLQLL